LIFLTPALGSDLLFILARCTSLLGDLDMNFCKSFLLPASFAFCLPFGATAATLCVDSGGAPSCYRTISAAVSAASTGDVIKVGPGTYAESITITKPISITTDNAILDASGMSRGFFVNGLASDGLTSTGLSGVNISGFTVRNANFEGILVLNASMVTLSNNVVMSNNHSLSGGTCPGLDAFETNEQSDCGEGIHLMGADHSVVINNTLTGNSGGILVSDDTGASHDNLFSFNTVHDNPYACGITLASHPAYVPASVPTGVTVPAAYGVYHNTVYANRSRANGNANGGGSGVGIFASSPGTMSYGNVVVANYLTENGLPGIAMHAHAPNQKLNDNLLVGNTLINNAADTEDAATPGPTGVNIYSLMPISGNMVIGNSIQNEAVDVAVHAPAIPIPGAPVPAQVQFNSLEGNGIGVWNASAGATVNATENFWSCPNGPTLTGSCSTVSGANILWQPWLTNPMPTVPSF
jgi:parallel beta-helix repeat protein